VLPGSSASVGLIWGSRKYSADHLKDLQNPLLRQWACLCLSKLWVNYEEAKWVGIRCMAHERVCELVLDPVTEVRAAMLYALTAFLGIRDVTAQVAQIEESIASMVLVTTTDGNSLVRKELLIFFSSFVVRYKSRFVVAAFEHFAEEANHELHSKPEERDADGLYMKARSSTNGHPALSSTCSQNTIYATIWKEMLVMSVDPHPEIARDAGIVVDHVLIALLESSLAKFVRQQIEDIIRRNPGTRTVTRRVQEELPAQQIVTPPTPSKEPSYLNLLNPLRRTGSVAASLKNLWGTHETPTSPQKASGRVQTEDVNATPSDTRPHTPERYQSAEEPTTRGFLARDSTDAPDLPLKSTFFEWSAEYFREPQMRPTEADEPGSTDYNGRLWRRNRNDKIIAETQPLKDVAVNHRWDVPRGYFDNLSQPTKMCFHQFEDQLVVTDNRNIVNVFDYSGSTHRLNSFSNGNPPDSKISEVRFINEDDQALLMTGSSDGVLKVYRHYDTRGKTQLVTAFRALTDLVPSNKNAGLVFDWQQGRGLALVAGDVKVIRVWNASTEICTSDIPARSGSCITSLTSDQVEGDVFIAGFGDGAVRVYDQRQKPATAMVKVWKEHKQWITNVHLQRGGQRELVSGCRSGEVKLWDIRMDKSVKTIRATADTLRTLSVHEHAPVFAT
jgi:regulatory associated protein of mTOR